jgi:undecaprenyl pyrophosphate phosphatase UppP
VPNENMLMNGIVINDFLYSHLAWVILVLFALESCAILLVFYHIKKRASERPSKAPKVDESDPPCSQYPVMQLIPRLLQSRQELLDDYNGLWLRDIAKYIATAVVFASMFQDIENKVVAYFVSIGFAIALFAAGTWFMTKKKKKKNKKDKSNINTKTEKL